MILWRIPITTSYSLAGSDLDLILPAGICDWSQFDQQDSDLDKEPVEFKIDPTSDQGSSSFSTFALILPSKDES